MKYELRFTEEHKEGLDRMYEYLFENYSEIRDGGAGKKRLLNWMRFVSMLKDRKTYSKLSQSKLNEIRQIIIKNKYIKT
tara:strand:- start:323 stop:559 length:237 start_codon:yes stop_codon:yes gene_type:complete